jgi:hypothetical protein
MNRFKSFSEDLKAMFSSPLSPASQKPSTNPRRVWIAVLFLGLALIFGTIFGILAGHTAGDKTSDPRSVDSRTSSALNEGVDGGQLVIQFNSASGALQNKSFRASQGTIVKVRLLNSLETFDSVPAFGQVMDYSLGQSFYGWTLIGDASSDINVDRIKIVFQAIKSPSNQSSYEIKAKALSPDGTLGIRADKVEGIASRAAVGSGQGVASGIGSSIKQSNDLSTFLIRALIQGLGSEISSDLGATYNRATALHLNPGTEFLVQLTDGF